MAQLSIEFAHPGSWRICKKEKKGFVRWPWQGASHCKHIQTSVVKYKCMPAKSTVQYNNWQTEKHLESREEPACFVTLSTGETVRKTHFSGSYAKRERKIIQNKIEQKLKSCFSPFVTSSSASNSILTSSPISWNRARDIISENKQTAFKRNLLTSLQLFWLLARRDTVVSKENLSEQNWEAKNSINK